jgi:radical SAM protein with 4Fe4S-binding SPASM domain
MEDFGAEGNPVEGDEKRDDPVKSGGMSLESAESAGATGESVESAPADDEGVMSPEEFERFYEEALNQALEIANAHPRFFLELYPWRPAAVVWELTLRCNMRCAHCGSVAGAARADELSLEECLGVCDDLGRLGCERLTLLGGEPFLHGHWEEIARRLRENNVVINAITNGYLLDEKLVERVLDAGFSNLGVSVDGIGESHDRLRRIQGSFERLDRGLRLCREAGLLTGAVTTLTSENVAELEAIHDFLVERGVQRWQVQTASPMGRLHRKSPLLVTREQYLRVIDFLVRKRSEGRIVVDPGDDMGYFGEAEYRLRSDPDRYPPFWIGCQAGCQVLGIESDGGIKGCLSLPSVPEFMEGNIRERSLEEIWNSPTAFRYNRHFQRAWMRGACARCRYAALCRAGCHSSAYCWSGSVFDNPYCFHRLVEGLDGEGSGPISRPFTPLGR